MLVNLLDEEDDEVRTLLQTMLLKRIDASLAAIGDPSPVERVNVVEQCTREFVQEMKDDIAKIISDNYH